MVIVVRELNGHSCGSDSLIHVCTKLKDCYIFVFSFQILLQLTVILSKDSVATSSCRRTEPSMMTWTGRGIKALLLHGSLGPQLTTR
jgi:hypothetical protein